MGLRKVLKSYKKLLKVAKTFHAVIGHFNRIQGVLRVFCIVQWDSQITEDGVSISIRKTSKSLKGFQGIMYVCMGLHKAFQWLQARFREIQETFHDGFMEALG